MTRAAVVITDLTRMRSPRVCLAGYRLDLEQPVCIRPLFADGDVTERWLFHEGKPVVRPFAVLEFDLDRPRPDPPHTEDWLVGWSRRRLGRFDPDEQYEFLAEIVDPNVAAIFGGEVNQDRGWFVPAGAGARSLGTVRAASIESFTYRIHPQTARWEYRLTFTDAAGASYRLQVTDLALRAFLDDLRDQSALPPIVAALRFETALKHAADVYLRIGLTRGWELYPNRCFLQITAVYAFPDYLSGRCYGDFPGNTPPAEPEDLSDVPF
jgi:hypothetical protein